MSNPITFTQAQTVRAGDKLTSTHFRSLARACNDRLRSGIGDPDWRIHAAALNFTRQVTAPDDNGFGYSFEPESTWAQFYAHVDPASGVTWPVADVGDEQGANPGSPIVGFVTGASVPENVDPEPTRITNPTELDPGVSFLRGDLLDAPQTPQEVWYLGKLQRGVYEADNGAMNAPAFGAAQSHFKLQPAATLASGKAFGGFMPMPENIGDCGDVNLSYLPNSPKYQLYFCPLRPGLPTLYFTGPCPQPASTTPSGSGAAAPCDTGGGTVVSQEVEWIYETPFRYVIKLAGVADPQWISSKDYILGPFSGGGTLQRTDAQMIRRMLGWYVADFRGTEAQRTVGADGKSDYDISTFGFDFQRFFQSQYFLSPNIGHADGADGITPDYPSFTFTGDATLAAGVQSTIHAWANGFVLGGLLVTASKLQAPCTINAFDGDRSFASITLTPDNDGNLALVKWFEAAPSPQPLKFVLATDATFSAPDGAITIECTEQVAYQPEIFDAYLVLRAGTAAPLGDGDPESFFDTRGVDFGTPKTVSDAYFANGCIVNKATDSLSVPSASVNVNPVYDIARRTIRNHTRVVPRQQFIGYEVAGGKSILYFNRYAFGLTADYADSSSGDSYDAFENIAPNHFALATGALRVGRSYVVRATGTDGIAYAGNFYVNGDVFNAVSGYTTFAPRSVDGLSAGSGQVFEYEGIRHVAPPQDVTNEWLMFPQFKVYTQADDPLEDTTTFKPDAYADYFSLCERCHFYNSHLGDTAFEQLYAQFSSGDTPGVSLSLAPEAPTGWRYTEDSNAFDNGVTDDQKAAYYASCRVYEPSVEIDSATIMTIGGQEVVKLVMTGRLHACPTAPTDIARYIVGVDTPWSDDLDGEPYRSNENGLREYLLRIGTDRHCSNKLGDTGAKTSLYGDVDNVHGACYPHFFFTHLVPEPYEDGNDRVDPATDTVITVDPFIQLELYLRAMCEGYVDGFTSQAYACATGITEMFDYTFENLCFDAFGGRWISFLPEAVRDDKPQGFGPIPDTVMFAEVVNQFALAWNKLTRARLMLPLILQCKQSFYTAKQAITPDELSFIARTPCSDSGEIRAIWEGAPPAADEYRGGDADFVDCGQVGDVIGIGASCSAQIGPDDLCFNGTSSFNLVSQRMTTQYRFVPRDANVANALPPGMADLINSSQTGFLAKAYLEVHVTVATPVGAEADAANCHSDSTDHLFWDAGSSTGYTFNDSTDVTTCYGGGTGADCCALFASGTLESPAVGAGAFYYGRDDSGNNCQSQNSTGISLLALANNPVAFVEVPLSVLS